MRPHVVALASVLTLLLPAVIHAQTTLSSQQASTLISTSSSSVYPKICEACACNAKQIHCNGTVKLTDLQNVRIPAEYNILDLPNNQLTKIHENSFALAPDVTEVNLAYNQINFVAQNSFKVFKNLTTLCLAHNSLVTLEDDSFAGLDKLQKLDISQNRFRKINPEYLAQLPNLKYLIMSENNLEQLHGVVFKNNPKLTQLFLNKGHMTRLDDDLFQYTRDLRILHLESNFIEEVPTRALSKLPLLEILYLSGNPIHIISAMAFPKLPNLQQLVLDGMYNLQMIEIYGFTDLPMLRNLKIQRCSNLLYIDPKAFHLDIHSEKPRLPQIKNFVLQETGVTILSKDLLNWNDVDDLDLSGNPFHCNCNLSWMVELVKKHEVNMEIRCSSPPALKNQVIGRISPQKMECDTFDPLKELEPQEANPQRHVNPSERRFSLLHLSVVLVLTATVVLSILLVVSVRRRGFFYRKLGGKPTPSYAGGENVLYMRTTVDY